MSRGIKEGGKESQILESIESLIDNDTGTGQAGEHKEKRTLSPPPNSMEKPGKRI